MRNAAYKLFQNFSNVFHLFKKVSFCKVAVLGASVKFTDIKFLYLALSKAIFIFECSELLFLVDYRLYFNVYL